MRFTQVLGLLFIFSFTFVPTVSTQDQVIVFVGFPKVKMQTSELKDSVLKEVPEEKVVEFSCVISKKGDKYYWKSREDREMEKSESGIYITFTRSDGAPDYVRLVNPDKEFAIFAQFDYVEHLTLGLVSVNYWGKAHIDPAIWEH